MRSAPQATTPCLRGTATRVKLDDGSHLSVIDDSGLTDFVRYHARFEGDEVAPLREDRVCLLTNLTGWTPKKSRAVESRLDRVATEVASSFPCGDGDSTSLSQKAVVLLDQNQTRWPLTTRTLPTTLRAPGVL